MKLRITQQQDALAFYGHGKLLITGEYFVLDGALALAVPTRFGQHLRVKPLTSADGLLYWVALNNLQKPWLNLVFNLHDFSCLNADIPEAARLSKVLTEARKLNPAFLTNGTDVAVETRLEFPNEWGLGTSSTLIHGVATWAGVNGYTLLQNTLGGSGYDVACAAHHTPILYQLKNGEPQTLTANWLPPFAENLYFAYLGKKQLSSEGIKYYREKLNNKSAIAAELTRLTQLLIACNNLPHFEELINEHEHLIASSLKMMRVKEQLFPDFEGAVKSLGAWGGDFVMLTHTGTRQQLAAYVEQRGITTLFNFAELIL